METLRLSTRESDLKRAGEIIRAGGLVAFPTETVYGLGANALDAKAVASVYKAKGRPSDNPMIGYLSNIIVNGTGVHHSNDWYHFFSWGIPVGILILCVIVGFTWLIGTGLRIMNQKMRMRR